jgi:hypothetical protein
MKKILLGTVLMISGMSHSQSASPDVIASAGAHFAIPSMQMSWTLGETVTQTVSAGSTTFTQGFQQANISLIGVETLVDDVNISVYPNPISDFLTIEVSNSALNSQLFLIDASGKNLLSQTVTEVDFILDFTPYAKGTYYLNFKNDQGQVLQTLTLQKIN